MSPATTPAWRGWPRRSPSSLPEAEILRIPRLGLPAVRPRLAQPRPGLRTHRHPRPAAGTRAQAARRADHRQRAGPARAATRPLSRAPAWSSPSTAISSPTNSPRFLEANGYGRADTVMEPGEYAIRGGIIDIFPAGEPDPVRLDLFGDTVESIRSFDPATQRSEGKRNRLVLRPVSEVPLDKDSVSRFRSAWRELFGQQAAEDPIYLSISDGRRHPGMEHWAPLFHPAMETLLDYLPGASVSLDHQSDRGPRRPTGNDRRPLRCPQTAAARRRGTLPSAAARQALSHRGGMGPDARRRPAARLQPIRQAGWRRRCGRRPDGPARSSPRRRQPRAA